MNTDEHGYFDSLTERVLGAVFEVSNTLGAGFLEKVYERALFWELRLRGIRATAQASLAVSYKTHNVGEYFADILVEDVLAIELKCVDRLSDGHTAQCINLGQALSARFRPRPVPSRQFPEAQSRVEAHRPWVSGN